MHLVRMAKYSSLIPRRAFGFFSSAEQDAIELAAPMHDIGKNRHTGTESCRIPGSWT